MFNISLKEIKIPALKAGLLFSMVVALIIFVLILIEHPGRGMRLEPEVYSFLAFYILAAFVSGAAIYSLFLLEKNMSHKGYQRLLIVLQVVAAIIGYVFTNQVIRIRFYRFFDENTFYLACGAFLGSVAITIIYFAGYYIYKWISTGFHNN